MPTSDLELTGTQLVELANRHIRRFENLLQSNFKNVRRDECQQYLVIWQRIKSRVSNDPPGKSHKLTIFETDERVEIIDAYMDGGYEDILGKAVPRGPAS